MKDFLLKLLYWCGAKPETVVTEKVSPVDIKINYPEPIVIEKSVITEKVKEVEVVKEVDVKLDYDLLKSFINEAIESRTFIEKVEVVRTETKPTYIDRPITVVKHNNYDSIEMALANSEADEKSLRRVQECVTAMLYSLSLEDSDPKKAVIQEAINHWKVGQPTPQSFVTLFR